MDLCRALKAVLPILQVLEEAGYEAYAVGGCVRDALRGVQPHDFDLTTNATPDEMLQVFASYRVHKTGLQHGTLTVMQGPHPIEITTYRTDGVYTDARHPDAVTFTASLEQDLARRDFTVNAIACDLRGKLCDPFGGAADIQAKILRCVGDAPARFSEDALRILRLFRFCAVLGFTPDARAVTGAQSCAPLLAKIAQERIYAEVKRALCGDYLSLALPFAAPIFAVIAPDLATAPAVFASAAALAHIPADFAARFFALCHLAGASAAPTLSRFRAENETLRRCAQWESAWRAFSPTQPRYEHKVLCARLGKEDMLLFLTLWETLRGEDCSSTRRTVQDWYDRGECFSVADMKIDGNDLLALGVSKGERLGALLKALLHAIWRGEVKNKHEDLIAHAKSILR